MINAQALSQTLSAMSLPMLQKYASLHRNDPYVVSLALSIANQKKQMMTAQQGMAGQQPMPKVVDSEIAAIAPRATPMPEDVGIGQLSADNLKGMCGGGIVAFDDGGEVPRFQDRGLVSGYGGEGYYASPLTTEELATIDPWARLKKLAEWSGRNAKVDPLTGQVLTLNPAEAVKKAAVKPDTVDPQSYDAAAFPMPTGAAAPVSGAPGAPVVKTPVAKPPMAAAPAAAPTTGIGTPPIKFSDDPSEYLNAIKKLSPTGAVFDPFEAQTRAIGAKSVAAAQEQEALRKKQMDELGIAGLKEEERYKKREEKLGKQEGELGNLAMLISGLEIMSGESPHALVNVGKGASVGLGAYIKGREKIDTARERLDDAYSRLEQARRGETILNQRELAQLSKDVRTAEIQSEKDVVAGARQAYGLSRDDAKAAASAYFTARSEQAKIQSMEGIAGLDRASREKVAAMQIQGQKDVAAANPERVIWDSLLKANNMDAQAAYAALTKLKTEKFNVLQSYSDYLKAWAGKDTTMGQPMDFVTYARQFPTAIRGTALPEGAQTRPPVG